MVSLVVIVAFCDAYLKAKQCSAAGLSLIGTMEGGRKRGEIKGERERVERDIEREISIAN